MAVTNDIVASWRRPREVMRRHLNLGQREDRALIFLMLACVLIFVAQLPYLSRLAQLDPTIPFDARVQSALYGWLFVMPLVGYALSFLIWGVLRAFRKNISAYQARLAFFWTLLAVTPASLFFGLCRGFLGDTSGTAIAGLILSFGFFYILIQSLREAMIAEA